MTSLDGTEQAITITINGADDGPSPAVIGGDVTGSLAHTTNKIASASFSPIEFANPNLMGFADFSLGAVEPTNIDEFTVEMWIKPEIDSTGILQFSDPLPLAGTSNPDGEFSPPG